MSVAGVGEWRVSPTRQPVLGKNGASELVKTNVGRVHPSTVIQGHTMEQQGGWSSEYMVSTTLIVCLLNCAAHCCPLLLLVLQFFHCLICNLLS
jgi:hypothetical protein